MHVACKLILVGVMYIHVTPETHISHMALPHGGRYFGSLACKVDIGQCYVCCVKVLSVVHIIYIYI